MGAVGSKGRPPTVMSPAVMFATFELPAVMFATFELQKYIECIEFSDQFHAIFQDGERPREGLTAQEKQQARCRLVLGEPCLPPLVPHSALGLVAAQATVLFCQPFSFVQGLITFCRFLLATLQMPACTVVVKPPTFDALVAAVSA